MSTTLHQELDKAIRVEQVAGELYRLLARTVAGGDRNRKFFESMADEEDQHAQRIVMLRTQYKVTPSKWGSPDLSSLELDLLLEEAQILKELFNKEGFSTSMEEARRFMISLEQQFIRVHSQAMISMVDPELRSVFEDLALQDRAHLRMLAELPMDIS